MAAVVPELLKVAHLLDYELTYVRQYVTTWAPEIARDLWPDAKPSPREGRAEDMLKAAETQYGRAQKAPAAVPSAASPAAARKPEDKT